MPLPNNIYEQLATALKTPVKLERAPRKASVKKAVSFETPKPKSGVEILHTRLRAVAKIEKHREQMSKELTSI